MMTKAWAWRLAAMSVAAILIPACKGSDVPATLFLDTFTGAYPGTNWVEAAPTGTAAVVKDVTNGVGTTPPFACVRINASSASSAITTETASTFNAAAATFVVYMAADTGTGTDGIGTVKILDVVATTVASLTWNKTTNNLTVTIGLSNFTIAAPAANLKFHKFAFSITAGGNGSWTMDNGSPLLTATGLAPGPWSVELGGSFPGGTSWASFFFDNVTVTTP